jgi:alkaline phosphatase D
MFITIKSKFVTRAAFVTCYFFLSGSVAAYQQESPEVAAPLDSKYLNEQQIISRIAFGSCYVPQFETPQIWTSITKTTPDLMLLLGDNVYQSEEKAQPELLELREAYGMLAKEAEFKKLREHTSVLATWDDHDYGLNDAGSELTVKYQSEALFEAIWPLSGEDERKTRDGIYFARTIGPAGKRVQVIMLDSRFFRSSLSENADPAKSTILGDEQWLWLQQELLKPAELRLLVSSIPLLSERAQGENWKKLPEQREKLFDLMQTTQAEGVVILSGDSHFAAVYSSKPDKLYTLTELSSSSFNFPYPKEKILTHDPEDKARIGPIHFEANFGTLTIDWENNIVNAAIVGDEGSILRKVEIALDNLHFAKK